MVFCAVLVLGPLWIQGLLQACKTEKLPRGVVVSWVWERVLEGLGLSEPPLIIEQRPNQERAKPEDRAPVRSPREAPVTIPWSPSAIHLLQRPSHEGPQQGDCHREQVEISFEELSWDSWIVHPKVLTFYYCHGNCSAALLGIPQCCAPVPGTMRSLRITTTSDGGYSFKYETLLNIIPE
ncbi:hypothetical protein XENOCAPTIV_012830 [Xenoophorus captivus]|uniref:Inhibin alpha chain n=1 Tax=Xenoophorus captivus TaxID=1517983 RepID=A0ABV0RH35_9TELE